MVFEVFSKTVKEIEVLEKKIGSSFFETEKEEKLQYLFAGCWNTLILKYFIKKNTLLPRALRFFFY